MTIALEHYSVLVFPIDCCSTNYYFSFSLNSVAVDVDEDHYPMALIVQVVQNNVLLINEPIQLSIIKYIVSTAPCLFSSESVASNISKIFVNIKSIVTFRLIDDNIPKQRAAICLMVINGLFKHSLKKSYAPFNNEYNFGCKYGPIISNTCNDCIRSLHNFKPFSSNVVGVKLRSEHRYVIKLLIIFAVGVDCVEFLYVRSQNILSSLTRLDADPRCNCSLSSCLIESITGFIIGLRRSAKAPISLAH
ncbi:hypothetical protein DERP_014275 [Dermatophagoides pteronyssinus]|uniref:Uncharacterized protein n=1 Tax=Dermatophagoides pteronyssinus TaxID=6956 RepID=A0ABQ8IXE9_DERPT|nr:hypothetical protein DERP_014275 [Dermatophagoides pteronyssinus]